MNIEIPYKYAQTLYLDYKIWNYHDEIRYLFSKKIC
jgi:hypothetical protein